MCEDGKYYVLRGSFFMAITNQLLLSLWDGLSKGASFSFTHDTLRISRHEHVCNSGKCISTLVLLQYPVQLGNFSYTKWQDGLPVLLQLSTLSV